MRPDKHDPYLTRIRESLTVPARRSTRRKLIGSMSVLALVLVVAAIWQFNDAPRDPLREPVIETRARREAAPGSNRAVFGKTRGAGGTADAGEEQAPNAETADRESRPAALPDDRAEAQPIARRNTAEERPEGTDEPRIAAAGAPEDVRQFLEEWRTTLISGDAEAQANLYAPRVEKFFTKKNVSRAAVQREKETMLARYPNFEKYDIRDVRVQQMDERRAVITFDKEWDARGKGRFAGAERQRLTLQRAGDGWEIVAEEELKVYWVKRDRRS